MRVFLSYRRTDVGGHAGRLADALTQRLGSRSVFQDVTTVRPGEDFASAIDRALDDCDALLAVIGPGWLAATSPHGNPRLAEAGDFVRLELARALQREVRVVPVLVGGATLPAAADLPDDLAGLVRRQATVLRDEAWHQDVDGLVRALQGEPATPARRRRRPALLAGGSALVVLAAVGVLVWRDRAADTSGPVLGSCAPTSGAGWTPVVLEPVPVGVVQVENGALQFTVRSASWQTIDATTWQVTLGTAMSNLSATSRYHGDYRYNFLAVAGRHNPVTCFQATPLLVDANSVGDAVVGFRVRCPPTSRLELGVSSDDAHQAVLALTPETSSAC